MKNIKETKERILESLEGKRTKQVWNLIEKAVKKIHIKYWKKIDFSEAKKEYSDYENDVNNLSNRFIVVEDYNIEDGFYCRFYEDIMSSNNHGKLPISHFVEDYFNDDGSGSQEILLVDMKEMKCYLLDREIKYSKKEVKGGI